ncbi:MAG TPA: holin [Desulfitobacteriaceae bacterium]|nr:holin [Desulfitobacteriaceae bacterium]
MIQNRLKSPVAWGAIVALVLFILKTYGLLGPLGLTEYSFKQLTTLIFATATAFGILNNPTDKENF